MTPTSSVPINKVSFPAIASMVVAVIFWALGRYAGVEVDAEGAVLITALVSGVVGYFTPIAAGEIKPIDVAIIAAHDAETKPIETRPL